MMSQTDIPSAQPLEPIYSSAIRCIGAIAKHWQLPCDLAQLSHQHACYQNAGEAMSPLEVLTAIRLVGWDCGRFEVCDSRLERTPMPAIVQVKNGEYWALLSYDSVHNEQGFGGSVEVFDGQQTVSLSIEAVLAEVQGKWILLNQVSAASAESASSNASSSTGSDEKFGMGWFVNALRKNKALFKRVLFASLCIQLIMLVSPLFFQTMVDKVLVSRSLSSLQTLAIAMLALAILDPIINFIRSYLFSYLTSGITALLQSKVYNTLMRLPLSYFKDRRTGDIIARIREMDQIRDFLTGSSLTLIVDLLFIGIFLAMMSFYSSKLTGIVLVTLVIYLLIWVCLSPFIRTRVMKEYSHLADNTAFLTETISGIETIKSMGVEEKFERQWQQDLARYVAAAFAGKRLGIIAGQLIGLVQKIATAIVLWFGVQLVLLGDLSMGQLIAFNMYAGFVAQPILRLAQLWQEFQHTMISLQRVGDIMNHTTEPTASAGRAGLSSMEGQIAFDNINFRYNADGIDVLRNFNLNVKAGEVVGITGSSGSGKSTLTKLVQRMYTPQAGKVCIDGMDLALIDPNLLRRQIGVVMQENTLFSGTLGENLRLNNPLASIDDIQQALAMSGAVEFLIDMAGSIEQALEMPLAERGGNLSGGQRQRITIAQALLSDPRILIFDEATSALDYESEAVVIQNMEKIVDGRTALLIAHRLNSLQCCDRIIVLEKGVIVEEGSHGELLALDGHYKVLWDLQNG